jgi:hypothetical protein
MSDLRAGLFDLVIEYVGPWSEALKGAFLAAEARIEAVVLGDLPDVALPPWVAPLVVVDDLVIRVELPTKDGAGGVLGAGVPVLVRSDSLLPITAQMRFDAHDAASLHARGAWDDVVLHEMLHCLGFGVLWAEKGLATPDGSAYLGPAALAEYAALGGVGPVPLENQGGLGTTGMHWSDAVFGTELMTGWISDGGPLTSLTIASLADLGYVMAPRGAWMQDATYA